jgi:hypothetical protein
MGSTFSVLLHYHWYYHNVDHSEDVLFDHTPFSFWTIDGLDRTCYLELILDSWRCMAQIRAHIAMMYMLEDRRENH